MPDEPSYQQQHRGGAGAYESYFAGMDTTMRQKLAFVMRNKFLGANIKASGIPVDQEAVIAAIARRDITGAAALVPDEAVEAFGIAGTPQHCTKRLHDFIDAGINEPVLGLLGSAQNCLLALDVMREFVA